METTRTAGAGRRQALRGAAMVVWVVLMPVTLYYFSPYLPYLGLAQGVVCGSVLVFAGQFAGALLFGRAFCGWLCPAGGVQDFAALARGKTVRRRRLQWIKYGLWAPWLGAWVGLAVSAAGAHPAGYRIEPFFQMEWGISVSRPAAYAVYLAVLSLILGLGFALGRRGFCHTACWMAPFMVLGQKLGQALRLPGLLIRGDRAACTACGACARACPMSLDIGAMLRGPSPGLSHHDCALCMRCADACPGRVLRAGFGIRRTPMRTRRRSAAEKS